MLRQSALVNSDAQLAIDMFCYYVSKQIASMIVALNGIDCLVFTGGIGENDTLTRAAICEKLAFVGLSINTVENQSTQNSHMNKAIHAKESRISVLVIQSNENTQIARHTWDLISH